MDNNETQKAETPTQNDTERFMSFVERLEAANKEHKALLEEQKALAARNLIGGLSEAGHVVAPKKELTALEYSQLALKGQIPKN